MDILLWSFPVFLILVGIEALQSRYDESKRYRLNDSLSNLSCGVFDQVTNAFIGTFILGIFALIQEKIGLFSFDPKNPLTWILLLLGVDFAYYWFHRASHRINLLWGAHIVHHQSESYNLTVSLRQGTIATWVAYMFYLPLAILGFSAPMFLLMHGLYQLYQFLVHTNMIKTLGPLEVFIATPQLHRVHHAKNEQYLDKNYGGLFNFWDRLFGSFKPLETVPDFGITTGIRKWNPLWGNIHYYLHLFQSSRAKNTWNEKIQVWFGSPEGTKNLLIPMEDISGYNSTIEKKEIPKILFQTVLTLLLAFFVLLYKETVSTAVYILAALTILLSLININAQFDRASWVQKSQIVLLILSVCLAITFFFSHVI